MNADLIARLEKAETGSRELANAVLSHFELSCKNARMWRYGRDPGEERIEAEEAALNAMLKLARDIKEARHER